MGRITPVHPLYKPARGTGTRPPFEAGNIAALRHGAHHPPTVAKAAKVARLDVLQAAPWLAAPEYADAVAALARTEGRIRLVDTWLNEHGVLDNKGKPRPAADLVVRLERQASDMRDRLGLSPLARARLGRDVASTQVDLARLLATPPQGHQRHAADDVPRGGDAIPDAANPAATKALP